MCPVTFKLPLNTLGAYVQFEGKDVADVTQQIVDFSKKSNEMFLALQTLMKNIGAPQSGGSAT
jgi:hypothetical protein